MWTRRTPREQQVLSWSWRSSELLWTYGCFFYRVPGLGKQRRERVLAECNGPVAEFKDAELGDSRGFQKCDKFTGEDSEWKDWCPSEVSYVNAKDPDLGAELEAAQGTDTAAWIATDEPEKENKDACCEKCNTPTEHKGRGVYALEVGEG